MSNDAEGAGIEVADAESAVTEAEVNVKQAQVVLMAAQRGADQAAIDQAEANVKQAQVVLMAAREKLKAAQGG